MSWLTRLRRGIADSLFPDIKPFRMPVGDWLGPTRRATAEELVGHVLRDFEATSAWYGRAKRSKQRAALTTRALLLISAGVGAGLPLVGQLMPSWEIHALWSTFALAVTAALAAYDYYFGVSSGWMRYVTTMLKAKALQQRFELQVQQERLSWAPEGPDADKARALIEVCKNAVAELNQLVQDETSLWMQEFKESQTRIGELARVRLQESQPGAVTLRVLNGAQAGEWVVMVDGGPPRPSRGGTAALENLAPGNHRLRVEGTIAGKAVAAETVVKVWAGQVAPVDVQLE